MLHTIWLITKIILIVLAAFLGIFLLFLIGLLVVPFRYRIEAKREENWRVKARISWLGFFLCGKIYYDVGAFHWKVFVFGIPIAGLRKKTEKRKSKKKQKKRRKITEEKNVKEETIEEELTEEAIQVETTKEGATQTETGKVKKPKKIRYTWKKIYANIKHMWHNTKGWIKLLTGDRAKAAFFACKTELFYLLKIIRPRRIKGWVTFGTGDPASTGQLLGLVAIFYRRFGKDISIMPEFEDKVFEGNLVCKGRLPLGLMLLSFWRIYKNKDLRVLKRKIEGLGGN